MILQPIDGRIIIRLIEKKKEGLIHLPDKAIQKHDFGIVLALADDVNEDSPSIIEVGDLIYFKYYAGTEMMIEGKKVIFIPRSEVLGITKKTELELSDDIWKEV